MTYEYAYCAGVMDSDGCFSIKKETRYMRLGRMRHPQYLADLRITQIEPEAIYLFKDLFGGSVRCKNRKRRMPIYIWTVQAKKAAEASRLMLPYLRIKRQQAQILLDLQANIDNTTLVPLTPQSGMTKWGTTTIFRRVGLPEDSVAYRESLWIELRHLHLGNRGKIGKQPQRRLV